MAIWLIRLKIIDRGLEGRMAIWIIRPKFCWELNLTNQGKFLLKFPTKICFSQLTLREDFKADTFQWGI